MTINRIASVLLIACAVPHAPNEEPASDAAVEQASATPQQTTATEAPPATLALQIAGDGAGTVAMNELTCTNSCSASFPAGSAVSLVATAATGQTFLGWSGACSGSAICSVTMTGDQHLKATFAPSFNHAKGFESLMLSAMVPVGDKTDDVYVSDAKRVFRMRPDGSINPIFTPAVCSGGSIRALTPVGTAGRLYIAGSFESCAGQAAHQVARFNADGTLDSTFSTGAGFVGQVQALAVTRDHSNDIYVGGAFTMYQGVAAHGIIRLNKDGGVETTFDTGVAGVEGTVNALLVGADDTLYVGGSISKYKAVAIGQVFGLKPTGEVETSFATGAAMGTGAVFTMEMSLSQSAIYVGGDFTTYKGVAHKNIVRLGLTGTADAFASGTGFETRVLAIEEVAGGDVYIGGQFTTYQGIARGHLVRLNADGSFDPDFDVSDGGLRGDAEMIVATTQGSIFVAGRFNFVKNHALNYFVRLMPNGEIDPLMPTGAGFLADVRQLFPVGDGTTDIYVTHASSTYGDTEVTGIVRMRPNGTLSPEFETGAGFNGPVEMSAPGVSGSIYAVGRYAKYNAQNVAGGIIRLKATGDADETFITGTSFNDQPYFIAALTNGDVLVAGGFTSYNGSATSGLARLRSNGELDAAFASNVGSAVGTNSIYALLNEPVSGDFFLFGTFNTFNGAAHVGGVRLNADGTVDETFDVGTGFDGEVYTAVFAADGSGDIFVGGAFENYRATPSFHLIRLHADGSIAKSFANDFDDYVRAIVPVGGGSTDLYVGGDFESHNGAAHVGMLRLHADGTVEETFVSGNAGDVYTMIAAPDGSGDLYIGGGLDAFAGTVINRMARISSAGVVR